MNKKNPSNNSDNQSNISNRGYVKCLRSAETIYLLENHPIASAVLNLIALNARRCNGGPDGLKIGEAYISPSLCPKISRKQYRTALNVLEARGHLKIIENCRKYEKGATMRSTKRATMGTLVKLLYREVWDINQNDEGHHVNHTKGHLGATLGPPQGPPPYKVRRMYKNEKNDKNGEATVATDSFCARTASQPRTVASPGVIFFDFSQCEFSGITEKDLKMWSEAFPCLDIAAEIKQMCVWCLSNETKAKSKKQWRRFITGWLTRNNEREIERKSQRDHGEKKTKLNHHDEKINMRQIPVYLR